MELLKKVREFKEFEEKARKAERELEDLLIRSFVTLPFEIQQVEIQEICISDLSEKNTRKVYYPVVPVPEGYKKEQEVYIKKYSNAVNHEYVLKDDNGTEIKISERAGFGKDLKKIKFPFDIINEEVSYHICIDDIEYTFQREFSIEEMLQKISKNKLGKAKYSSSIFCVVDKYAYSKANEKYEKFLTELGISEITTSLRNIVNSKCEKMMLNSYIKAEIKVLFTKRSEPIWLESQFWNIFIYMPVVNVTVIMDLYTIGGLYLSSKEFEWYEIADKKYEKGITFQEAMELIKE